MTFSLRRLSRSAFLAVAVTALVLNFAFDVFIFKGKREANLKDPIAAAQYLESLERDMQLTLVIDFIVIAALMLLFHINLSEKIRIERNLKKTLNTLRETLLSLEEEIFRRKAIVKTTVHDLKNPLGSILGFAELLGDRSSNVIETSDYIQRISRRTLALVESMVHAEEAHAYDLEKLDPHELVRNVCSELEVMAHAKGQRIIVYTDSPSPLISVNKLKIEELISNLVSNAIKYSPPKTKIQVFSRVANGEFLFSVEDEGPGFTEEDRAKAFQYGVTLGAKPTKGESSSGFGLFISKQIVTSHRGHIEIESAPGGHGARVSFGLPLA